MKPRGILRKPAKVEKGKADPMPAKKAQRTAEPDLAARKAWWARFVSHRRFGNQTAPQEAEVKPST